MWLTSYLRPAIGALLALAALVPLVVFLALLGPRWLFDAEASHQGGTVTLAALDMDPSDNTVAQFPSGNVEETTLGTIDECVAVTHPATFDVDVVVQGYPPATDSLVGYEVSVTFSAGLRVMDSISGDIPALGRTLVSGDPQSGVFFSIVDQPNYGLGFPMGGPNSFDAAIADLSPLHPDESIDGEENSDGFLLRLTFETTAAGPALLPLTLNGGPRDDAGSMIVTTVQGGSVAVDAACTPATLATALDDPATVDEDSGANAINVLANDSDGGSPPLTIISVTQASNGNVAITGGGSGLTYEPAPDFFGADSFIYTIQNADLATDTATVNVIVNNVPDLPVANPVDMGSVLKNSSDKFWLPDVSDADGDTLTCSIVSQPANGAATVASDCSIGTYTPDTDFTGTDSFNYRANDASTDSNTATVTVTIVAGPAGVLNGGFETCTLASWTVTPGSVASAIASLGPSGPFTPILPAEGQCMAFLSTAGTAPTPPGTLGSVISQTFITPADASALQFCYQYVSNDSDPFENFFLAELDATLGSFTLGSADNSAGSPAGGSVPPPPPAISVGVTLSPDPAPVFLSGVNILGSALLVPSSLMTDRVCSSFSIPAAIRGTAVTLRFAAGDALDTVFDSAVVVDEVGVTVDSVVGGIVDFRTDRDAAAAASGSPSTRDYTAPDAAALATGMAIAIAAGGWYARRRWLR